MLSRIGSDDQARLITAISVVDEVWDRKIFDHPKLFGGPEVGDARTFSAAILIRLLDVEYAALASAAGGSLPPTGSSALDEVLEQACHDTLNTFSDELLGPERVEGLMIYGLPMRLDSPAPVGAVLLATKRELSSSQESLLREFLRHLDTRLTAAERLYSFRREIDALYARHNPYEFRAANVGEVFALIAVHRTFMLQLPDQLDGVKPALLAALPGYQAARAFLFAYEQFSEVPLRGEKRHEPHNAHALLFRKKNAPSFGLLLRAYQEGRRE